MNILLLLIGILLIFLFAWLFWDYRGSDFKEYYVSKSSIWRLFKVSDKTFKKWLNRFMPYYAPKWAGRKNISVFELALIKIALGDPEKFPPLNMEGIMNKLHDEEDEELIGGTYRLFHKLVPNVKLYFTGISTFPPAIAEQIYLIVKGDSTADELYTL